MSMTPWRHRHRYGSSLAAGLLEATVLLITSVGLSPAMGPSPAEARSYHAGPREPPGDRCLKLNLAIPGKQFPVNLVEHHAITLSVSSVFAAVEVDADDFELEVMPAVARKTAGGYEDVLFELVVDPALFPNARALRIADLRPGEYVVSWLSRDSCTTSPSPDGRGQLVGQFIVTEKAPIPQALGEARWRGQTFIDETVSGQGGSPPCRPVTLDARVTRNTLEVTLPEQVRPWLSVIRPSARVSGHREPARVSSTTAGDLALSVEIDHICQTDPAPVKSQEEAEERLKKQLQARREGRRPECGLEPPRNRFDEGEHEAYFAVRFGKAAEVRSSTVSFEISCQGDKAQPSKPGEGD